MEEKVAKNSNKKGDKTRAGKKVFSWRCDCGKAVRLPEGQRPGICPRCGRVGCYVGKTEVVTK